MSIPRVLNGSFGMFSRLELKPEAIHNHVPSYAGV